MMDERMLNSTDVLRSGILNILPPETMVPDGARMSRPDYDFDWYDEQEVTRLLEAGGITASMYYGCWDIWRTEKGYSGQLMQYRSRTDSFTDESLEYALVKVSGWSKLDG